MIYPFTLPSRHVLCRHVANVATPMVPDCDATLLWPILNLAGWTVVVHKLQSQGPPPYDDDVAETISTLCEQIVSRTAEGSPEELGALLWRASQIIDLMGDSLVEKFVQAIVSQQVNAYKQAFLSVTELNFIASVADRYEWLTRNLRVFDDMFPSHWDVPFAVYKEVWHSLSRIASLTKRYHAYAPSTCFTLRQGPWHKYAS